MAESRIVFVLKSMAGAVLLLVLFIYIPAVTVKKMAEKKTEKMMSEVRKVTGSLDVSREDIIRCLKLIKDPEFQINIYDLGLVKEIKLKDNKDTEVVLQIYSHCPYKIELYLMVKKSLQDIQEIGDVRVKIETADSWDYLKLKKKTDSMDKTD